MEQKINWIKETGFVVVAINLATYFLYSHEFIKELNIVAFWALLHLWITIRVARAYLQSKSATGGAFWVLIKLGSLLAFAQILTYTKKLPPEIVLIGLTPFLVVPLVGSFFWSRRESSDASRT